MDGYKASFPFDPIKVVDKKDSFTDHNFQTFFAMTVETLVRPWEKMIMNMRFTEVSFAAWRGDGGLMTSSVRFDSRGI